MISRKWSFDVRRAWCVMSICHAPRTTHHSKLSLLLTRFFEGGFKTRAAENRQNGVFVIAGISFGPFAHEKEAAPGALNHFDVPAGGAESNVG